MCATTFRIGRLFLLALRMFSAIEQTFGTRLPMAVLFQAPTIEQLADVLADEGCAGTVALLVAIQPEGKVPLFAVPGVGGNVLVFARLAKLLGDDQPLRIAGSRTRTAKEKPFMRVEEMAAHCIEEIRSCAAARSLFHREVPAPAAWPPAKSHNSSRHRRRSHPGCHGIPGIHDPT